MWVVVDIACIIVIFDTNSSQLKLIYLMPIGASKVIYGIKYHPLLWNQMINKLFLKKYEKCQIPILFFNSSSRSPLFSDRLVRFIPWVDLTYSKNKEISISPPLGISLYSLYNGSRSGYKLVNKDDTNNSFVT